MLELKKENHKSKNRIPFDLRESGELGSRTSGLMRSHANWKNSEFQLAIGTMALDLVDDFALKKVDIHRKNSKPPAANTKSDAAAKLRNVLNM